MSLNDVERLSQELLEYQETDLTTGIRWTGSGPEVDLTELESLAADIRTDVREFLQRDRPPKGDEVEGARSVELFRALEHLPLTVIDDPGFWRYIGLVELWDFLCWREPRAFESREWSKYRNYIDGRRNAECVALRMFIRGRLAVIGGDATLAAAVPEATDLWRSHIVRVRTGYSPSLAAGLLRAQLRERMPTDQLRDHARRLNRLASNVVLHTYGKEAVDELMEELRDK